MDVLTTIITSIIPLLMIVCSIYVLILFIMVANRGIKALDIYINEKKRSL